MRPAPAAASSNSRAKPPAQYSGVPQFCRTEALDRTAAARRWLRWRRDLEAAEAAVESLREAAGDAVTIRCNDATRARDSATRRDMTAQEAEVAAQQAKVAAQQATVAVQPAQVTTLPAAQSATVYDRKAVEG